MSYLKFTASALVALTASAVASMPLTANAANSCDGNAASVVDVTWVQVTSWGGHYDTTNNDPSRGVTVTFDQMGGGSMGLNLEPHETKYPGLDSYHPLQVYKTPCHANYR